MEVGQTASGAPSRARRATSALILDRSDPVIQPLDAEAIERLADGGGPGYLAG